MLLATHARHLLIHLNSEGSTPRKPLARQAARQAAVPLHAWPSTQCAVSHDKEAWYSCSRTWWQHSGCHTHCGAASQVCCNDSSEQVTGHDLMSHMVARTSRVQDCCSSYCGQPLHTQRRLQQAGRHSLRARFAIDPSSHSSSSTQPRAAVLPAASCQLQHSALQLVKTTSPGAAPSRLGTAAATSVLLPATSPRQGLHICAEMCSGLCHTHLSSHTPSCTL
jgi:hypothetical protein